MLHEFLATNQDRVLALTEAKSRRLAGTRPSSAQLEAGLPIFFNQLLVVLQHPADNHPAPAVDENAMVRAAGAADEPALAEAEGRPYDAEVAKTAGLHGTELLRLGYTLSHVVHAYGSMCQAITELAAANESQITATEFNDLNRCLDVAIAGAVTAFQADRNTQDSSREVEHLGFLAHELRNALSTVNVSLRLIKSGTVGFSGSTGQVLNRGLKRIEELIDRSLTEVRLRVDPKVHMEPVHVLQLLDQIAVTADVDARAKNQTLEIQIDPALVIDSDQQLLHSALSNLIQNAIKFTRVGGRIQVRGRRVGDQAIVAVEDECGGLSAKNPLDLLRPYDQQNADRSGLGLGLTIAKRAITLNHGTIDVDNLPGKGCIFTITLPLKMGDKNIESSQARAWLDRP